MTIYKPMYSNSHALVIGINEYESGGPLKFARSDAEAVAEKLVGQFGFPEDNVVRLYDAEATQDAIRESYLAFTRDATGPDDRVLVFYAGHGHTIAGARGEVGYLVPHDGSGDRIASLIRWDEFTQNAELIAAKHVLFVMDACYGGLALRRGLPPGSTRLLRDMLARPVRQVLASGKADESGIVFHANPNAVHIGIVLHQRVLELNAACIKNEHFDRVGGGIVKCPLPFHLEHPLCRK